MDETPEVWSTIALDRPIHRHPIEDLEILLAKSKMCPIEVYICPRRWPGFLEHNGITLADVRTSEYYSGVVPCLQKHQLRLRAFFGDMDKIRGLRVEKFFLFDHGRMQNLKYLQLDDVELEGEMPPLATIHTPSLVSLQLWKEISIKPLAPDSFRSLRQMYINATIRCPTFYLNLLSACLTLEILHWDASRPDIRQNGNLHFPDPHVILPLLKHCRFSGCDSEVFRPILGRLHIPLLESLEIQWSWYSPQNHISTDRLQPFLTMPILPLRKLSISNVKQVNAAEIYRHVANLIELGFYECFIDHSFFSTLMKPQVFSQLERIRLQDSWFSVSDLTDFVQSKCRAGGAAQCNVHIVRPRGLSKDDILTLKHLESTSVSYGEPGGGDKDDDFIITRNRD
ncbi:hypothetical protein K439DRAFT_1021234 [Ramaria rubella]|nr:hypothetical protein K439DRAFT_1021234 [Ramaria rubella]